MVTKCQGPPMNREVESMAKKKQVLPAGYREKRGKIEYRFTMYGTRYSISGRNLKECMENVTKKLLEIEQEREEQEKLEAARKERAEKGLKETNLSEVTLDGFYDVWEQNRRIEVKPVTVRKQRFEYNAMSAQLVGVDQIPFGSMKVREIIKQHVLDMRRGLLSYKTVNGTNQSICLLKHVLDDAVDNEIIDRNPAKNIKAIPIPRTEKDAFTSHRALTIEETQLVLEEARKSGLQYCNLITFLLYTGMRHGEACVLRFGDIHEADTGAVTVRIDKTITKTETGAYTIGDTTKTAAGVRTVFLLPEAVQAVRDQRDQRRLLEHREIRDDELIFTGPGGGLCDVTNTTRALQRICKRVNVPPVSCHALRATFATRCVESGTDYKSLSEHLGHKDIGVTMNTYAKALEETREKEIRKAHIM